MAGLGGIWGRRIALLICFADSARAKVALWRFSQCPQALGIDVNRQRSHGLVLVIALENRLAQDGNDKPGSKGLSTQLQSTQ